MTKKNKKDMKQALMFIITGDNNYRRCYGESYNDEAITNIINKLNDIINDNNFDGEGYTALMLAIIHGNEKIARLLIKSGANLDIQRDEDDYTALMLAIKHNNTEIARLLIENRAGFSTLRNVDGDTALMLAIKLSHKDIADYILSITYNSIETMTSHYSDQNNEGNTALMLAIQSGYTDIVQQLLNGIIQRIGLDFLNATNNEGNTALMLAIINNNIEVAKLLIENGANLDIQRYEDGCTALMLAIINNNTEVARLLIESRASLDIQSEDHYGEGGYTALMLAIIHDNTEIARLLIENRASLDIKSYKDHYLDEDGYTALMLAFSHNNIDIARILIEQEANLNNGNTALMLAIQGGSTNVIESLLYSIPECIKLEFIDARNNDGNTALMLAIKNSDIEITEFAKILIEKGVIYRQNNDAYTTFLLGINYGHTIMLRTARSLIEFLHRDDEEDASHLEEAHESYLEKIFDLETKIVRKINPLVKFFPINRATKSVVNTTSSVVFNNFDLTKIILKFLDEQDLIVLTQLFELTEHVDTFFFNAFENLGMHATDVPHDGNCFFHALNNLLLNSPNINIIFNDSANITPTMLRQRVAEAIQDQDPKMAEMIAQDGRWVDLDFELIAQILAELLGINIVLVPANLDENAIDTIIQGHVHIGDAGNSNNTIYLGNINNIHFVPITADPGNQIFQRLQEGVSNWIIAAQPTVVDEQPNEFNFDDFCVTNIVYENPLLNNNELISRISKIGGAKILNDLLELSKDQDTAVQILEAVDEVGVGKVLEIFFGDKIKSSDSIQVLEQELLAKRLEDDQLLETIAKIEAIIGKGALAELAGWHQYISKALSNNYLSKDAATVIQAISNMVNNLEEWLDFADIYESIDAENQVAIILAQLEVMFDFVASGITQHVGLPPRYPDFDPDDYYGGSGGSSGDDNYNGDDVNFSSLFVGQNTTLGNE